MTRFSHEDSHPDNSTWPEILCVTLGQPDNSVEARADACLQFAVSSRQLLGEEPTGELPETNNTTGNPACFLLRQSIELALKIPAPGRGHDLKRRLRTVRNHAVANGLSLPTEFEDLVRDFDRTDRTGVRFRYAFEPGVVCCIDPRILREDINTIIDTVENVLVPLARIAVVEQPTSLGFRQRLRQRIPLAR